MSGFMMISIVNIEAHSLGAGVNVYVVVPGVLVLITSGDQVPTMGGTLLDVPGNEGGVSP